MTTELRPIGWGGGGGGGVQDEIADADNDTGWRVEQNPDEDRIRGRVAGVEAFLLSDLGILTLAKQSGCHAYAGSDQTTPAHPDSLVKIMLDTEEFDIQNEFNNTVKTGVADATAANKLHHAGGGFAASDVGATVWNTTDNTYTTVSGYVDSGELDLTDDIMVNGEGYTLFHSRFTALEAGKYVVVIHIQFHENITDQKWAQARIHKNGSVLGDNTVWASGAAYVVVVMLMFVTLAANDYIEFFIHHSDNGGTRDLWGAIERTFCQIVKIL